MIASFRSKLTLKHNKQVDNALRGENEVKNLSWDEANFAFQRGCPFALLSSNMFTAFLSAGPQTNCYCLCSAAKHLEEKYEESENVNPLLNLSSQSCSKIPWKHIKPFHSGKFTPGLLKRPRLCCVRAHRFIPKQRLGY